MPGLSFVFNLKGEGADDRVKRSLDALIHGPDYSKTLLATGQRFVLASTGYPEYPVRILEFPEGLAVIEGRLYNVAERYLIDEMRKLSGLVFEETEEARKGLVNWLLGIDGDFIIFLFRKDIQKIALLNDAMGRLSWCCFKEGETIIMSRELRFIANVLERREFDRMAIAEYFLFGHTLGKRTLVTGIEALLPATLVRIDVATGNVSLQTLHTFNFDSKEYAGRSIEENAARLIPIFRECCRNRAGRTGVNVVSLSGGMDSRSVAVGLHEDGIPFVADTFLWPGSSSTPDATVAGVLAKLYSWDWQPYFLEPPRGRHFLQLLRMKNAFNSLGMSFALPFLEKLREKRGTNVTYFTGDGGDRVLYPLRPTTKFAGVEELLDFLLLERELIPIEEVAELTRLEVPDIKNELLAHLSTYPERDFRQRYVHYCFYEKDLRWVFEGEDRNRFYFWSVAPFYSIPVFTYSMNCPDEQKEGYALYRHFLQMLSPPAAKVAHPDGIPPALAPGSYWYGLKWKMRMRLKEHMPIRLRLILTRGKSYSPTSIISLCLREQLRTCDALQTHLSSKALEAMVDASDTYSMWQLENVFSVTSLIEDLSTGHSAIETYADEVFGWHVSPRG